MSRKSRGLPPLPMAESVPESMLLKSLGEMITPVISVPQGERAGYYRSMERLARIRQPDAVYDTPRLVGLWLRIANVCWPEYPVQEDEARADRANGRP